MEDRTTIQITERLRKKLRVLASKRDISYEEVISDMVNVFVEIDNERTILSIPTKLAEKIRGSLVNTDMASISQYVTFVLRLIYSEKEQIINDSHKLEQTLKDRLHKLGYLD